MFEFLDDIHVPVLIYDQELLDYIFVGKTLLNRINISDLREFKGRHCHKSSIFATLLTMQSNNTYDEKRDYYFFAPDYSNTMLYFKIKLTAPLYLNRKLVVFALEDCTETQALYTQLETYRITQSMICSMINSIYIEKDTTILPPYLIASLGITLNVSTVMVYEIGDSRAEENAYIWHNENIKRKFLIKNVTARDRQFLYEQFLKEYSFIVEAPEQLDPENERRMELADIKSLAAYPIYIDEKPKFTIILLDCISYRNWRKESEIMELFTTILSNVLSKKQKLVQTKKREAQFKAILDSLPFYIHASDYDTHEIIFANQFYKDTLNKNIIGMKCWQLTNENNTGPCSFCKMNQTVGGNQEPNKRLKVRYLDAITQKEYQLYENAIQWFDGRYVHFTCAIPIEKTE